jgi:hypothetical protein
MTTLEYMEKQVKKHRINYEREAARNAPEDALLHIREKIGHYEAAVQAFSKREQKGHGCPVIATEIATGKKTRYASMKEAAEQTGILTNRVSRACLNDRPVKGFYFRKENDVEDD